MIKKHYTLYQLPPNSPLIFMPYKKDDYDIDIFNYVGTYSGEIDDLLEDDLDICEELFNKFNCDWPESFAGHSMSVSDIIRIYTSDDNNIVNDNFYFCDIVGFKDVTDKIEKVKEY